MPAGPEAGAGDPTWEPVVERLRAALANEFDIDSELRLK